MFTGIKLPVNKKYSVIILSEKFGRSSKSLTDSKETGYGKGLFKLMKQITNYAPVPVLIY